MENVGGYRDLKYILYSNVIILNRMIVLNY